MTEGTHYITYDLHVLHCVYLWYKCWCGRAHLLKARGGCQVPSSVTLILSLRQSLSLSLSLEFTNQSGIYLPLPLKQWDYENVPPYLAFFILHGS